MALSIPQNAAVLLIVAALVGGAGIGSGAVGAEIVPPGASPWTETEHSAIRLISASETSGNGDALALGIHVRLPEGWKTYWRSPGDAGFAQSIDWTGSHNIAAPEVAWPAPKRFSVLGLDSIGYEREVIYPISAQVERVGEPVVVRATVDYLVCSDICVPQRAELALDLPAGPPRPSALKPLIEHFAAKVPRRRADSGIDEIAAAISGRGENTQLRVTAVAALPFDSADVFVEGPPSLAFGRPRATLEPAGRRAVFVVPVFGAGSSDPAAEMDEVTVTLVDGERAVEELVAIERSGAPPADRPDLSFFPVLGFAILGGLILNLMPCVLPVLSIKLLGVIGHGGGRASTVRLSFAATAAGILFSFLVLAAVVAALRSSGAAVGWGLQFQQPWFLTTMALVTTLFSCNLWGFFEVPLPRWIADAGERAGHVRGLGGHFLTGALAALLATPCSAPFLGTAIGFALSREFGEIVLVFLAIGVGLSLPYLVVALLPRLATALPRPGRWMTVLRRLLGFGLAATSLWLLFVLSQQLGTLGAAWVGATAAAIAAALYIGSRSAAGRGRWAGAAVAGLSVIAFMVPGQPAETGNGGRDQLWQPFDIAAIPGYVAGGQVVYVNITADWCVTCRVNDELALSRERVRRRLASDRMIAMRGDWTRPNQDISRFLERFGRYGIPFDAVFGPQVPNGEALPELLSPEIVLDAIDRAEALDHRASTGASPLVR
jgi:suppressor for copper-sensitivity B